MDVHARNVSEIISRLRARRIAVVFLDDQKIKDAGIARQAGAILCGIFSQNVPREDIIESGGQKGTCNSVYAPRRQRLRDHRGAGSSLRRTRLECQGVAPRSPTSRFNRRPAPMDFRHMELKSDLDEER